MTSYSQKVLLLAISTCLIPGCASMNNRQDPLEPMNRAIFSFNEKFDEFVLEPAARGYHAVVPDPIEMIVGNFFSNIGDVAITANSLLQLKFADAAASSSRVLINTTFGLLGAVDLASHISQVSDIDISKRNEDFGQTLGYYGVGAGPYIVLPILGPSTVRDTVGTGVDGVIFDPLRSSVYNKFDFLTVRLPVTTVQIIDIRAQNLDLDKTLEEAALDKYEFVRDAYLQRRESLVRDGDVPKEEGFEEFEDLNDDLF
ncbi:MAG TPA: VacJ family lipoprotein [Nitrosomonas mobilis]|uniref:Putative lipoprotein (VacJ) transmembrane n=2 Tax=Nitrosomonas mobilis TaxID=51642 RepID=A0A1G5SEF0_9PROT|nr:putative lipoprotein (VacJ) transmembrane [Nitrosomonas mobilis]HNO75583.1 VacJ family lipoprotein [Nitrosomonas mobilis]